MASTEAANVNGNEPMNDEHNNDEHIKNDISSSSPQPRQKELVQELKEEPTKLLNDDSKEEQQQQLVVEANTTSDSTEETDTVEAAHQLLSAGKRHLACDDFPQAVETLAESCQLLSEKFGDGSDEVAEAYYYYGKSLLELARMENGVLGNALDGVTPEEENEAELSESDQFEKASTLPDGERETIVTEVYSAMAAEEKGEAKSAGDEMDKPVEDAAAKEVKSSEENKEEVEEMQESTESADEDGEETVSAAEDTGSAAEDTGSAAEDIEEAGGSSQEEMEEADDIPNLQLAWEILELAKGIYLKKVESEDCDKSVKVRLGNVYRVLGEVSLETGTYEQAIQDIASCLHWESACMESDDRRIAETHYLLGNAHLLNRDYTQAVEQLRTTKSIIELRISNLEASEEAEGKESRDKERDELKALLPDVIAKVEDVEDECRDAQRAESEVKAVLTKASAGTTTIGFGNASATDGAAVPTIATKANDISNLVRKRKPEEQGGEEIKKARQEVVNGATIDKENGATDVATGDH